MDSLTACLSAVLIGRSLGTHQGAFYVLGEDIVRHLYRSRDLLTVMSVEDAMVGLWLLGIDKVRPLSLYLVQSVSRVW